MDFCYVSPAIYKRFGYWHIHIVAKVTVQRYIFKRFKNFKLFMFTIFCVFKNYEQI